MVILADFILEFRFEFLWPFWLLLRSVYDSFKYQGLVSCLIIFVSFNRQTKHHIGADPTSCWFYLFFSIQRCRTFG